MVDRLKSVDFYAKDGCSSMYFWWVYALFLTIRYVSECIANMV